MKEPQYSSKSFSIIVVCPLSIKNGQTDKAMFSATNWIDEELKYAKSKGRSSESSWGRKIILAISKNDAMTVFKTFNGVKSSNINEQCQLTGYADYMWTPYIHEYIGDTALHLALKQKMEACVSALLLLGADCNVPNKLGETAETLCGLKFGKTIANFEFSALRSLLTHSSPTDFKLLPDLITNRYKCVCFIV